MEKIQYCKDCNIFTMKSKCSKCSKETKTPFAAKFSIEDKYGKYRLEEKLKNK